MTRSKFELCLQSLAFYYSHYHIIEGSGGSGDSREARANTKKGKKNSQTASAKRF